jgi:ParB/RepB/Spo0J family partition protein
MTDVVEAVDPFACRLWDFHDRLDEYINEDSCREIIESFRRDGQKHPVLARPSKLGDARYELIFGARRLFAARHLGVPLLARIRELHDRQAFVEMDIENRLRSDISPYERGMAFKTWLRAGRFESQDEIAKTLGISAARVCRLMKVADLPAAIVMAFPDPREIRESWGVTLAERCAVPETREQMLRIAREMKRRDGDRPDAKEAYRQLLDGRAAGRLALTSHRDHVIRADDGRSLFRISHRHNDLHIVIPRSAATRDVLDQIANAIKTILEITTKPQAVQLCGSLANGSGRAKWNSRSKDSDLENSNVEAAAN